jgi:hypothetical protein
MTTVCARDSVVHEFDGVLAQTQIEGVNLRFMSRIA